MEKPQLLQLIQKGDRQKPTIYKFGAGETLCLYRDQAGTIEICDLQGRHIRSLNSDELRDWGYSPAKLIDGDEDDQFFERTSRISIKERAASAGKTAFCALICSLSAITVSNITGCSDYVMQQLDKDIATSTVHPASNYDAQIKFKQANEHANRFLASSRNNAN